MNEGNCDLTLLALWRSGDNEAGGVLVRRYFAALHRFFALKTAGQGEDLIQQTFMACVEAKHAFRGESSFRAYLFGLARYQLLTHYRKVYRRPEVELTTTSLQRLSYSPSATLSRRDEQRHLYRALESIPLDQQIALELTYWEGLAAIEIAHVLGIPENTVYSRLRRAKENLRDALEQLDNCH